MSGHRLLDETEREKLVNEITKAREDLMDKFEYEDVTPDLKLRLKVGGGEDKIAVSFSIRPLGQGSNRCAIYFWELRTTRDVDIFWNQLQSVEDSLCSLDKLPY